MKRMRFRSNISMAILTAVMFFSCSREQEPFRSERPDSSVWLLPKEEVIDAGVGKDGIPSVDAPQFSSPAEIVEKFDDAFDNDLILGIEHDGEIRAYPVPMLNWHEIVNDDVNGLPLAITYCPLTGTGIGWSRMVAGALSSFGVSGLLFNNNLMPYDRRTNSTWSQMQQECVNGFLIGDKPKTYTLIETTFATWKKAFPDSKIMNANTGFDRRYSVYPYFDYRQNHDLLFFPLSHRDDRLPAKERVLGVVDEGSVRVYRFSASTPEIDLIRDQLNGTELLIVRCTVLNFMTAYIAEPGVEYLPVFDALPTLIKDSQGNLYDMAGRVVQGPNTGSKLEQPVSYMGFWFSWAAFYPDLEVFDL